MKILGIDYGKRKVGLAISDGPLAEPLKVIEYSNQEMMIEEIKRIVNQEKIDILIIGISEGQMGEESAKFSHILGGRINIPIEMFDETLTTEDAKRLSIEAGIAQRKRHKMEDAYAASVMLQNYLNIKH